MSIEFQNAKEVVHCQEKEDGSLEPKPFSSQITEFYRDIPVISKELSDDKQVWKLFCKSRTYNKDEDLTSEEYVSNMKDWILYVSSYDKGYIGDEDMYEFLTKKGIILFQKINPSDNTCSIGYSCRENKWYGWSHRAIYGFTIGDEVKEGDITATSGLVKAYRIQHPEEDLSLPVGFKAYTMTDAKRMAIAFASAIG